MELKRVLVIGAGISGAVSIVQLKDEGLEPVCYERSDNFGGTWFYRNESMLGQASLMPTTVINQSKEMGALSTFPPNKEYHNFMKHTQMYQYIYDYVKHYECEKYIHYKMEVLQVKRADDYEITGKWSVTSKNLNAGKILTEIFDGVIVATGHINKPSMPKFPGQDDFTGEIMHTHSLKDVEKFKNKRVVVVGTGCSALDAAVEISRVAKQVYLSSRSGAFIWNRFGRNGYPTDYTLFRRYLTWALDTLPINFASWYLETFYMDTFFDHRLYTRKPKYHVMSRDPILNDHIHLKFLTGEVVQKANISKFVKDAVVFDDENFCTEVDSVIVATGYTWGFPFLENGIIKEEDGIIHLYKCLFPPHLPHPTLAILGFILPFGASFPLIEMQARWVSYLMAVGGKLPSVNIMIEDIVKRHITNEARYITGDKMSIRVDFVQYLDEIAKEFGVKPNLFKYLFTDFPLFLKLLFGPNVSYQYRLEGRGKWNGARDAIMTVKDRVEWPLMKRPSCRKGIITYIIDYIINLIPVNVYIWK